MKKLLFTLLLILILFKSIIFFNQEQIMHPQKRVLQTYHYDWLNNPSKHGMHIEKHQSKNATPYLIVTQNLEVNRSKRQETLLKQLADVQVKDNAGVLVLLHGKNGRKEDLLPVAERYVALGFRCLLLDLPHHGESEVEHLYYATTKSEQHYVDEVLDDASQYIAVRENLYIWGMSLGGAFTISSVAHSQYKFKAMVLVSTFDSLDKVLKQKSMSIFGEVLGSLLYQGLVKSLDLFYDFSPSDVNSAKIAKKLKLPLYMVHGAKDELISHEQGKRLFENFASSEKTFYLDAEGDHHNILITKHEFYKESGLFLLKKRK